MTDEREIELLRAELRLLKLAVSADRESRAQMLEARIAELDAETARLWDELRALRSVG